MVGVTTGDQPEGPRYYPSGSPSAGSSGQYAQYPQNPYGATSGNPYPYTPYSPSAFEPEPPKPKRPGAVVGAFVLLVLAALPFCVFGVFGLFVPITQDMFPAELGLDALLQQYNVSFDEFVQSVRLIIAVVAVLSLLYIGLAAAALAGKNWGRIAVTVLTVLFGGFLLLGLGSGGSATLAALAPIVLSVAGVVLLFRRRSSEWFASRR